MASNQGFISIRRTCPACSGSGVTIENPCDECREKAGKGSDTIKIDIPPGVDDGNRLAQEVEEMQGLWEAPGDLYVEISVKDHKLFERDGDDLFHELAIPFTLAVLGGTIEVPTLNGKVSLKIPSGTQSNKTFRIKDKGMPNLRSNNRSGNLYARINIEVPTKLTSEQRTKLVEFAKVCGEQDLDLDEGFMEKMKKIL